MFEKINIRTSKIGYNHPKLQQFRIKKLIFHNKLNI
jgi:hypothetical protein